IFRIGNHLFMYCTVPDDFDPQENFQGYTQRAPRAREWNDLMMTFQQKVPEAGPNDWWAPAKLVFDSEWFEGRALGCVLSDRWFGGLACPELVEGGSAPPAQRAGIRPCRATHLIYRWNISMAGLRPAGAQHPSTSSGQARRPYQSDRLRLTT